jgi:hypothetical protein
VPHNLVRLSVGLEEAEDLWRDLEQALAAGAAGAPADLSAADLNPIPTGG